GLQTVADVRRLPLETLRRVLGARAGTLVHQQAQGLADDRVYPDTARKSISKETTFGEDVSDRDQLRETLRWAAQEVGYLARHAQRAGLMVTLKVRFRGFETHTRSRTLAVPSVDDRVLIKTAWELFEIGSRSEGWSGRPVRLIGLGLSGWDGDAAGQQPDLFAEQSLPDPHPRDDQLTATLDAIRDRFGKGSVQRGLPRQR
ncbi:MAG: DNA polymerase IV, partial [Thiohalocapsa sp.]